MASPPGGRPSRFGNYEIISLVGKGGMADVYRARVLSGPRQGQAIAIKRLLPALSKDQRYVDLFLGEADLSRTLKHPNIVETFDAGVLNGTYYIAMELIDGRDLGQVLLRCREKGILLPVDFGVFLVSTLLSALHYAHTACGPGGMPLNVVHCDVSPSNVFISRKGEIRLGDFGIAKARQASSVVSEYVRGKSCYLSPEAMDGVLDIRTDLWAATVTLYEVLTNERPFGGTDAGDVEAAVRARRYRAPSEVRPEVPFDLDAIVAHGFALDASARHQTALEFAEELAPHYDELVGTPLAIAAVVRGLFGA